MDPLEYRLLWIVSIPRNRSKKIFISQTYVLLCYNNL